MPTSIKRVFYVQGYGQPVFAETLATRNDITLSGIQNSTQPLDVAATLQAAHVYQVQSVRDDVASQYHVTEQLLQRTPNLLLVSTMGSGYDTVDLAACTRQGVLVVNQAGANAQAVAEHTLGMLLNLSKRIVETDHIMRRRSIHARADFMGHNMHGKTLGLVGLGHIGSRLAQMCRAALDMRICAYDPYVSPEQMHERGAKQADLPALLQQSDYVCICCPLTTETRNLIDAPEFAHMKPGAFFVTTARGGIHNEDALLHALRECKIAGAGLDVWENEPPSPDHPLLQLDNVLASPHTAGVTHESRHEIARAAAVRIIDAFDGKRPANILNPEVWPRYAQRFGQILGLTG